jgi:uncharacterized protein involved in exopolysaccharide biosynthesis
MMLAHRRLMFALPFSSFAFVVLLLSFQPSSWTSGASFVPQSDDQQSGLARVAAQLGVAAPGSQELGPAFYVEFLNGRSVLSEVLLGQYTVPTDTGSATGTLLDLLEVRAPNQSLRVEKGLRALRGRMTTDLSLRTSVVSFTVRAPNPVLAQQVAQRFLNEVNRFNVERRQSRASAQRLFAENRLAELKPALREAEDRLQSFIQQNRDYRNSPQLTFQQERLAREISLRQQAYVMMNGAYEQARIDEVRDTPVITIVEPPVVPAMPDPRRRLTFGLLALFAGGFFALLIAVVRTWVEDRRRAGDPELASFMQLRAQAAADVKRLKYWVRRLVGRADGAKGQPR